MDSIDHGAKYVQVSQIVHESHRFYAMHQEWRPARLFVPVTAIFWEFAVVFAVIDRCSDQSYKWLTMIAANSLKIATSTAATGTKNRACICYHALLLPFSRDTVRPYKVKRIWSARMEKCLNLIEMLLHWCAFGTWWWKLFQSYCYAEDDIFRIQELKWARSNLRFGWLNVFKYFYGRASELLDFLKWNKIFPISKKIVLICKNFFKNYHFYESIKSNRYNV